MTHNASTLKDLPAGPFHRIEAIRPLGTLVARRKVNGAVAFYWRYSHGASSERVAIGLYDSGCPVKQLTPTAKGYSLAGARRAAEDLAREHYENRPSGGRRAIVQAKKQAEAEQAARASKEKTTTLKHLLEAYCERLEEQGKRSHYDARNIFLHHVFEAFPDISARQANELTPEDFVVVLRRLHHELQKGRTANKLRSYARAAYEIAKNAKVQPTTPTRFLDFAVSVNPVAATLPDSSANKPALRPLSLPELQRYWRQIKVLQGFRGALLRLHLLTGGQRIEQLVRLRSADIEVDRFKIFDGKGRPGPSSMRTHVVPLTTVARTALSECRPCGEFALSTDGGKTHVSATTLSRWAAKSALSCQPVIADFEAKRIRSGVETLLSKADFSKEHRGRLQSHGISGVQDKHYDGNDFFRPKLEALKALHACLEGKTKNVR